MATGMHGTPSNLYLAPKRLQRLLGDAGRAAAMVRRSGARVSALGAVALRTVRQNPALGRDVRQCAQTLHDVARELARVHGIQVTLSGALPDTPSIVVSNHISYIDPVVVGSLLPCAPIAKDEVVRWPVVGAPLERMGVIFVRRGNVHHSARALLRALHALEAGVSVLNFPEGTTSRDQLLPFKYGIFGVARLTRLPVVPLALRFESPEMCWVGGELFLPHYLRATARTRVRVHVTVGKAIDPRGYAHAADLGEAAHRSIRRLLADSSLRAPLGAPETLCNRQRIPL
jgi:1-acyl-sn-glycerol-3-phosphate acyltransferase